MGCSGVALTVLGLPKCKAWLSGVYMFLQCWLVQGASGDVLHSSRPCRVCLPIGLDLCYQAIMPNTRASFHALHALQSFTSWIRKHAFLHILRLAAWWGSHDTAQLPKHKRGTLEKKPAGGERCVLGTH